jgi:hypothetical protein
MQIIVPTNKKGEFVSELPFLLLADLSVEKNYPLRTLFRRRRIV